VAVWIVAEKCNLPGGNASGVASCSGRNDPEKQGTPRSRENFAHSEQKARHDGWCLCASSLHQAGPQSPISHLKLRLARMDSAGFTTIISLRLTPAFCQPNFADEHRMVRRVEVVL